MQYIIINANILHHNFLETGRCQSFDLHIHLKQQLHRNHPTHNNELCSRKMVERWKSRRDNADNNGPFLDISPGDVEEAVHYMKYTGEIDLSELRFVADHSSHQSKEEEEEEEAAGGVQSFLDIAIFEVPEYCTSQNCDLSRFGVGEFTEINGMPFLGLCKNGRLIIDDNIFRGKHSQLMVPSQGSMPSHIKSGSATFKVPSPNRSYDVMIANCNDHGRHVHLTGGVVFSIDADDSLNITPGSLMYVDGGSISSLSPMYFPHSTN